MRHFARVLAAADADTHNEEEFTRSRVRTGQDISIGWPATATLCRILCKPETTFARKARRVVNLRDRRSRDKTKRVSMRSN